ncbi:hypothetical protein [Limosilactobacillus reuteri]|nr:hypothetical protein [Limosilactobacillus reuteri]MDD1379378.1 hypothetical protein [Limosilactobacillus reuteri]
MGKYPPRRLVAQRVKRQRPGRTHQPRRLVAQRVKRQQPGRTRR